MRIFSTAFWLFLLAATSFGAISDHVLYVEIVQTWDYGNAASPQLLYGFSFTIEADDSVEYIELVTPASKQVVITESEYCDDYGDWWKYEYDHFMPDPAHLSEYGDGIYQMTVHYHGGSSDQTQIEYSGMQQPTQEPIPVYPMPEQNVVSPVTFQWESCTDPAPNNIWFDIEMNDEEVIDTIDQSTGANGTDAIELNAGSSIASIGFENTQPYTNSDGIWVSRWKTSSIEWNFTVVPPALSGSGSESDPYLIQSLSDFEQFSNPDNSAVFWTSDVYAKLTMDIDLAGIAFDKAVIAPDLDDTTEDFVGTQFAGNFDGDNNRILNLTIDTQGNDRNALALFGSVAASGVVANLGLENVTIIGSGNRAYYPEVEFTGGFGGLCGNNAGHIHKCWVNGSITGGVYSEDVGGLCGWNQSTGTISRCYVTGSATCGINSGGIGGLCGSNDGSINNSWTSSSITGKNSLGGLCGYLDGGSITNCYSIGEVNGTDGYLGGFCGERNGGSISNCYWDTQTSGMSTSNGGIGKTTAEMKQQSTFQGWDFINVWDIGENQTYPYLRTYLAGDINKDRIVNFIDLSIMAVVWLNCDLHGYSDTISDHVFEVEIETGIDFSTPDSSSDDQYEFSLSVVTDTTVEKVKIIMPSGNHVEITKNPEGCVAGSGTLIQTCHEFEDQGSTYEWGYSTDYDNLADLAVYEGSYTLIIYYGNGYQHQTVVSFSIAETGEPIPQPTQKPVYTSFSHGEVLESPITLTWEPCTDPDLYLINVSVTNTNTGIDVLDIELPGRATELGESVNLDAGDYEIDLSFDIDYEGVNQDGVLFDIQKWCEVDYSVEIGL